MPCLWWGNAKSAIKLSHHFVLRLWLDRAEGGRRCEYEFGDVTNLPRKNSAGVLACQIRAGNSPPRKHNPRHAATSTGHRAGISFSSAHFNSAARQGVSTVTSGANLTGSNRPSAGIQRTEWPSPKGTLQVGLLAGVTAAFSVAILNLGLLEFTYPLNGEYQ